MATLKKIKKGQTVTEQVDLINENVENINVDLEKVVNNEAGYITENDIPVKKVNGKTGDVSLSAKDVGAFPNSSNITELDINNIKETGVYIGTYATNPYYLIVIKYNDTNIYQELIGAKFKEYRRFTGVWSEWIKDYSTENPVKAGDIKGIELVDTDKELTLALFEDTTFVKADIKYNPSSKSLYIGDEKFATEQFVRDAVNMVKSIIVAELPETGIANTIYFVPSQKPDTSNTFEEYIYVNGAWEIVGGTTIDLTPFLTIENAEKTYAKIFSLDEKVSKTTTINGKTLYSNITLTAEDVGALPKDTILVEDVVYRHTNEEINGKLVAGAFVENDAVISIDDGTYLKGHIYKYNNGTLTDITDIITDYVDLNNDQNINGTKNFNGILRYAGVNVATEDDIKEVEDKIPSVDSSLSTTSTNPVENKAITTELNKKALQSDLEDVSSKIDLKASTSYVDDNFVNKTNDEIITGKKIFKTDKEYDFLPDASLIIKNNTVETGRELGLTSKDNTELVLTSKYDDDTGRKYYGEISLFGKSIAFAELDETNTPTDIAGLQFDNGDLYKMSQTEDGIDASKIITEKDYAGLNGEAGLIVLNKDKGVYRANLSPQLEIVGAIDSEIEAKKNKYKPITPLYLDHAVKVGITTNTIELTDNEKNTARTWIGATDTQYVNDVAETKQDKLSSTQLEAVNSGANSTNIAQITTNKNDIADLETNKASIEFVNSSIATNTATFRGTYESVNDLPTTSAISSLKENDYAFVIGTSNGNPEYQRYKYTNSSWEFEYTLNNSSFTAQQWNAINSGITSTAVGKISTNEANITNLSVSKADKTTTESLANRISANEDNITTLQNGKEDKANLKALAYKDSLSKGDVGLGDVDNTSDANKPISTATQTALNNKVDKTRKINGKALNTDITLNATDVGALPSDTPVVKYGFSTSPVKEDINLQINLLNTNGVQSGAFSIDTANEMFGTAVSVIDIGGQGATINAMDLINESFVTLNSSGNIQKTNMNTGETIVASMPTESGTLATTNDIPDTSSFIDKNVDNLTNYTNNSELNNLLNQKQNTITSSNKLSNTLISGLGTASTLNTGTSSGNVPVLGTDGKLPSSVVPATAITDTFVVNSSSAQLALTAQVGDVCVRTDLNRSYILKAEPANDVNNWQELLTPTDAVQTVNGLTGNVVLDATSVGAVPNNTAFYVKSVNGQTGDVTGLATTDVATTSNAGLMSISDKTKLNGIASGAEVNVQADWNETDDKKDAYIKNKPDVPAKYDATKTYKSGDFVLYVNRIFEYRYSSPSAGNAPPTAEAEQSNTYWIATNSYRSQKVFVGEITGDTNPNQSPLVFRSSNTSYGDTLYRSSKVYVNTDFKLHDSGGEVANTSALNNYLPKSGGTITGTSGDTPLTVQSASNSSYIGFRNSSGTLLGYYGVNSSKEPVFYDSGDKVLAYKSDIPDTSGLLKLDGSNTMTGKLNLKATGANDSNVGDNGIRWGTNSLPQDTAPQFICTIDAFADGGRQKWTQLSDLKSALGVPTVNNGTLTIQQDGTTLGTFTANQSGNTTVNIAGGGGESYKTFANFTGISLEGETGTANSMAYIQFDVTSLLSSFDRNILANSKSIIVTITLSTGVTVKYNCSAISITTAYVDLTALSSSTQGKLYGFAFTIGTTSTLKYDIISAFIVPKLTSLKIEYME